jgi:ATP-binding protein involved in chromosome partitioning
VSRLTGRVDEAAIRAALVSVPDPELRRPLADLGMIGEISARRGRVRIEIRLTTGSCPLVEELRAAVTSAVAGVTGVRAVDVVFAAMSARERFELARRLARETPSPVGGLTGPNPRVLAVASGKGGVGKSTVTANLAAALAASGERVAVLDADVWGYSIPQLFGVRRNPVVLGQKMLPVPAHGVGIMSVGFFVTEDEPVVWRGPMLHKAIDQFVTDTLWGELDTLLVDLPPGTGDATLSVLELLPDCVLLIVTTPQTAAHVVAARTARMALDSGREVVGVIENMSSAVCASCGGETALFGSGGGRALVDSVGAPLLGQVPLDVALREAGDLGVPAVLRDPSTPSARALTGIATSLPTPRRRLAGRALPLSVANAGPAGDLVRTPGPS